jgi:WhiB family redox-sensing transcriptional regulator
MIARVRDALAAGMKRHELPAALDTTPGRVANAMFYIHRWEGTPVRKGQLPPAGPLSWMNDAACKGMPLDVFFGADGERGPSRERRERKAKRVCDGCPVRDACRDFAILKPAPFGTWGGMGEDERAKERRKRLRLAAEEEREAS